MPTISFICLYILAFITSSNLLFCQQNSDIYFPIVDNELIGYINIKGEEIISPKYRNAGPFSQGLAPVRADGTYGYINSKDEYAIESQFDYAESFIDGIARVYIDGKPFFIDKKGCILFDHEFLTLEEFGSLDYARVMSKTEKWGVVDKSGGLIIDTLYSRVRILSNHLFILEQYSDAKSGSRTVSLASASGELLIPFGIYSSIDDFSEGLARARLIVEPKGRFLGSYMIIDTTGEVQLTEKRKIRSSYDSRFSEGKIVVDIYSIDPDSITVWSSDSRHSHKGVVDTGGDIILEGSNWKELSDYSKNRALVKLYNDDWYLIDDKGTAINSVPFLDVNFSNHSSSRLFENGYELVEVEAGWVAIDEDGDYLVAPQILSTGYFREYGSIVVFRDGDKFGYWDIGSRKSVAPKYDQLMMTHNSDEVFFYSIGEEYGYINTSEDLIWRSTNEEKDTRSYLNIDFMNRGYFYAQSFDTRYEDESWYQSSTLPKKTTYAEWEYCEQPKILIDTIGSADYIDSYYGLNVSVLNCVQDTLHFNVQDGRLNAKIQALDATGKWRDVEYLPRSWCGNSYYEHTLPLGHQWRFVIPQYKGVFKTKLRVELEYKLEKKSKENYMAYSHSFEGSVNPAQFWRKEGYSPSGIMDPYFD